MPIFEIVAILALTAWSVYQQTKTAELSRSLARFKMAGIYAAVGLVVGGFDLPSGAAGWLMIVGGFLLSAVVGVLRGRLTTLWVDSDNRIWRRGTALTVGLFIGMIGVKFALGVAAFLNGVDDGAGFGEVMLMIAIMIAVQAQLLYARARALPEQVTPNVAQAV